MACYKHAADLGDVSALNNIGLMLEFGYDDVMPNIDDALLHYKAAHNLGNSDATINIAIYYLRDICDLKIGKALLINAYQNKNYRALDCMMQYGICQHKGEVEGVIQTFNLEDCQEYVGINLKKPETAVDDVLSLLGLGTHSKREMMSN